MSQTTTALGTVPQTIVNLDGADLVDSAAFTTAVEFDTHGSERIALHVDAANGSYTFLTLRVMVRDAEDGTYYVAPVRLSAADLRMTAASSEEAFQVALGRNIDKIRVQYKTDGGGNHSDGSLVVKGQLTAPTFPIIGGTL